MHDNTANMQENHETIQPKSEHLPEPEPSVPENQPEQTTQAPADHSTINTEQPQEDVLMAEAGESKSSFPISGVLPFPFLFPRLSSATSPTQFPFHTISSPQAFTSDGGKESNPVNESGPSIDKPRGPYFIHCSSPRIRKPSSTVNHPT